MSDIEIHLVTQPTAHTCVHACLSMVTGLPIGTLTDRFGEGHGLSSEEEITVLTEMGILPVAMPEQLGHWHSAGVYLVTTPSINLLGSTHRVVVQQALEDDDWVLRVFDPNVGREGVLAHGPNALFNPRTMKTYGDVVKLVPMRLHKGTDERLRLYAARSGNRQTTSSPQGEGDARTDEAMARESGPDCGRGRVERGTDTTTVGRHKPGWEASGPAASPALSPKGDCQ